MGSVRADVRDEVLERLGDSVRDIIGRITEQVPAYAALSPGQLDEVRAIAEWGTRRLLQLWVEDGELAPSDLRRFTGIGAARALDARPLPGVQRAYRLAGEQIADLVEQHGGARLTARDAMAFARLWMGSVDALSEALSAGHAAASERVSGDRVRAVADLVDDLLVGRQVTRTALADRSRALGVVLDHRTSLLVLVATESATPLTPMSLADVLTGGEEHEPRTLVRVRGPSGVVVLPDSLAVDEPGVGRRGWRACRVSDVLAVDLPRAHRLAEHLLDRAPDRAFTGRALLDEADAQVAALLGGQPDGDVERLDELVLSGLRGRGADHVLQGLEAYLAAGSATGAAELLGIHPQTMRYRLRRLQELTGRDPRRPWDRLVLEAASLAHDGRG